jgi:hypothetical protein
LSLGNVRRKSFCRLLEPKMVAFIEAQSHSPIECENHGFPGDTQASFADVGVQDFAPTMLSSCILTNPRPFEEPCCAFASYVLAVPA